MAINHAERAYRAWPILVRVARQPKPAITYGELAAKLDVHPRAVRYILSEIQDYCLAEKKPPLTILVVNAVNRLPGEGFIAWDIDDLKSGIAAVARYPWEQMGNPFAYAASGKTEDGLAEELVADPSQARDIYALVRVRGTVQSIFRKALLKAYDSRCAICGLSFEEALEAAHLIPWSEANSAQRMSPTNGILLCSTHHRLFDAGMITVGPKYVVTFYDPGGTKEAYSEADRLVSTQLHGRPAIMPAHRKHRPTHEALAHHHKKFGWSFS